LAFLAFPVENTQRVLIAHTVCAIKTNANRAVGNDSLPIGIGSCVAEPGGALEICAGFSLVLDCSRLDLMNEHISAPTMLDGLLSVPESLSGS
jgi:hypothetical protein